jgi:N-methylhydantoinase A/oxoprolinase/acetone carboxylase beta subunit
MDQALILGIDVGGTNTDAVLLNDQGIRAKAKVATSDDIQKSILNVISSISDNCGKGTYPARSCFLISINKLS